MLAVLAEVRGAGQDARAPRHQLVAARARLAALDVAWAVGQSSTAAKAAGADDGAAAARLVECQRATFKVLKSLSAMTRASVLKPEIDTYGADPATRYRGFSI